MSPILAPGPVGQVVLDAKAFGARGDGRLVADAAITAASATSAVLTNFGLSASSPYRFGSTGSGLTALPASITPSSLGSAGGPILVGIT